MPSVFSRILNWGFRRYVRRFVCQNFNAVRVAGQSQIEYSQSGPVICYLNHPGWWDPMTGVLMTDLLFPGKNFHAPIDAEALKQYPILSRLGFFAVDRDSVRGTKEFLSNSRELLKSTDTMLWITPTGSFHDVRHLPGFMPGLSHLLDHKFEGTILSMAVEYTFWSERTPELLVEFAAPLRASELPVDREQRTQTLRDLLASTQQSLAQKSISRDPAAFSTCLLGKAGVGGIYQSLQRVVALLRGQRFHERHRQESNRTRVPNSEIADTEMCTHGEPA